jgi:hypothetical protein
MNQTQEIETAPQRGFLSHKASIEKLFNEMHRESADAEPASKTLGEQLQESVRRAERLLSHYQATGRKSEAAMLDRDISQAKVRMSIGNIGWMRDSLAVMTTYED